ncbi:MAG: type II toxin-antitoxin system Phd/YefM family antitoxin [Thiohalocapsa sp.]
MTGDILSLSQFKADTSRLLAQVRDAPATLVLTQNGCARAVVQDYKHYQARERAMLMLKLMAQGERDISSGDTLPQAEVFAELRQRLQLQRDERDS